MDKYSEQENSFSGDAEMSLNLYLLGLRNVIPCCKYMSV